MYTYLNVYHKATDKQIRLIRYLEGEYDPPTRLSHETLHTLSKKEAGSYISRLSEYHEKKTKERQLVLL